MLENYSDCYLGIACLLNSESRNESFVTELDTITDFLKNVVSKEDYERYKNVSKDVVKKIALKKNKAKIIYKWIYDNFVLLMIVSIILRDYDEAYKVFLESVEYFEKKLNKNNIRSI